MKHKGNNGSISRGIAESFGWSGNTTLAEVLQGTFQLYGKSYIIKIIGLPLKRQLGDGDHCYDVPLLESIQAMPCCDFVIKEVRI